MNTSSSPKTKSPRLRPAPWDAAVVLVIVALAAFLFLFLLPRGSSDGAPLCSVSQDGAVLEQISLRDTASLERRTYGEYTLLFSSGRVCIEHAPCDNQDCVHTGFLPRAGQSIVCLPGRFIVELSAADEEEPPFDIVVK